MDFSLRCLTACPDPAVSIAEAKEHLRIDDPDDNAKLERSIAAATRIFERMTRRSLMRQTWLLETSCRVCVFELPRPPLIEVTSINVRRDMLGDWEPIDLSMVAIESNRSPARVRFRDGGSYYVQVTYEAGHDQAADVPEDAKLAILQLVTFDFENRGDVEAKWPIALRALIDGQRSGTTAGYWHHE